ncbi:MAG: PAS domain-containing protein [Gemmatimonadetes bacterium]|nr:PAS domain-containing protein [Gemmatimonadota bacterium]
MTPVLLVLPLATMLLGLLMRDRVRRDREFADLAETKTRLALALAAGRQGTFDLDPATGLAVLSREYVTMLGHDPATFGASAAAWLDRALHPDDRLRIAADFRDVLAGRRLEFQLEFRQRTARGDFIWIHSLGRGIDLGSTVGPAGCSAPTPTSPSARPRN